MPFSNHFNTAGEYFIKRFGRKVCKLPLALAETCPNRDGTCGTGGCIFCSVGGSGEFAASVKGGVAEAILAAKELISGKLKPGEKPLYVAYFQSFTSTHAPFEILEKCFTEAVLTDDVAAISVATRPDALPPNVIALLGRLNLIKPVFVELGLQTSDDATAGFINRCCGSALYKEKALELRARGIEVIMHMIVGLPCGSPAEGSCGGAAAITDGFPAGGPCGFPVGGTCGFPAGGACGETDAEGFFPVESLQQLRATCEFIAAAGATGVKIQVLSVLKNTALENYYDAGKIRALTLEEYGSALCDIIGWLPADVVIHRITGDPPKELIRAPLWTQDKKKVMNYLSLLMDRRGVAQGSGIRMEPAEPAGFS